MKFTKMHGLGNNYVLFNQLDNPDHVLAEEKYSVLSRKVSDVNFGIGSDGIILICPSESANFKMRIFNADGSEAKNCGNGLRCVAKYLFDRKYARGSRFTIETLGGIVSVETDTGSNQQELVKYVNVDMGKPQLLKGTIPMEGNPSVRAVNEPHIFRGKKLYLTCVSMGNPHAILFVDEVNAFPLEEIGPVLEQDSLFPDRVNVGIVQIKSPREINYRVWERGSGMTMACGTGACAAVVAGTLNQRLDEYKPVTVHLPGGDLTITWDAQGHVWKRGEAAYICAGDLNVQQADLS
ncbi:diaminopimelate epimerase [Virgibacillus kimchii]